MGLADRMDDLPGDFDALDFTWGVDCGRTAASEWCFYREPHEHGFACDKTCPCRTNEAQWRHEPWRHKPTDLPSTSLPSALTTPTGEEQHAPNLNISGLEFQADAPTEIATGEVDRG